eukprot:Hpha_TRINITY_DN29936_c0_g1::TRINITY_DN29936_c0_g1_i1::g.131923::m.131923
MGLGGRKVCLALVGAAAFGAVVFTIVETHQNDLNTIEELRDRLSRWEGGLPSGCNLGGGVAGQGNKTLDDGGVLLKLGQRIKGTDKLHPHDYGPMYSKYLAPLSGRNVRMLEIGLGCNMPYGPGHSAVLWRALLGPKLDYYVAELDPCLDKWKKTIRKAEGLGWYTRTEARWARDLHRDAKKRAFWGDQANSTFLRSVKARLGGPVDVIIDDGGHSMEQQLASFEHLFPMVRPGGFYFMEDLETSFYPDPWGGSLQNQKTDRTAVGYLRRVLTDFNWRPDITGVVEGHHPVPWSHWIRSLDCDRGICVIVRRSAPFVPKKGARDWKEKLGKEWEWPCKILCRRGYCRCAGPTDREVTPATQCGEEKQVCGACAPPGGTSLGRLIAASDAAGCDKPAPTLRFCRCQPPDVLPPAVELNKTEWFECCRPQA